MLRRTLIALPISLFLTSCGIQGSLYLPPDAKKNSYIYRLRQEFNDFIGTDTIGEGPDDNDTVIDVVDPKNFTINGQPLEEQEGSDELPMEGADEDETGMSSSEEIENAYSTPLNSENNEGNSAIMHELPVRGSRGYGMESSETE